ncbi:UNVERIFIED_ORG: TonB-dependent receptor [Shinella sp. XGS7]|nr:TonB-dependent receptor [Shinella sp. XGS7]
MMPSPRQASTAPAPGRHQPRHHRAPALHPLARAAALALVLGSGGAALAAESLERVDVTGSAIKRAENESALPLQVITRAEIDKSGATTAAELMSKLAANVGGLSDGASISDGRDQRGFNSASLRGLGTSSTLVLLNGRRMANFAAPGDDSGVDLNIIPAAAIQRVEVLLDGASSLYGSDAIGGVINFITRKDYRGAEITVHAGGTQEGGAGKRSASLAGGFGDLARDRFNVFAVLDLQKTDALRSSQRKFIGELKVPERLPHLLSSYTSPANVRVSGDQRDFLAAAGYTVAGRPLENRTFNPAAPGCNPPASLYLPLGIGGDQGCTYDYMRDTELYPKSDKSSLLARGVFQLTPEHQLYAEFAHARARSWYVASSARVTASVPYTVVPALRGTQLEDSGDELVDLRMRLLEAGNRTSDVTSTGQRLVLGLNGTLAGWDYDLALNRSRSTMADRDTHGYLLYDKLIAGIERGLINPFGPSSAEGRAYIDSIQINDLTRRGVGTMNGLDFKASRALTQLAGGELMLALGGELRRERVRYRLSQLLLSDNINNDGVSFLEPLPDPIPADGLLFSNGRKVQAWFAELAAPLSKQFEAQLSLRQEHTQGVGSALSPKLALRYTPSAQWMLRASLGRGFRAPSLDDLYRPPRESSTSTLADPVCMAANDNDLALCADNWTTRRYSNPNLKPERSRQGTLGVVFEPSKQASLGLDFWDIRRNNLISDIGDDVILSNLDKYGSLVHRDEDGDIDYIELRKDNRGAQQAQGFDFSADLRELRSPVGEFALRLRGTLTTKSRLQTAPGDAFVSNLGRFVTQGVVQRWRHRLSLDWTRNGRYGLTLSNSFSSGYEDQNKAIDTNSGTVVQSNRVKAYSIWDLSGWWDISPQLTLRAGVLNLANTAPPYSNQAYYFLSGYDPSYTDTRGRFGYLSLRYAFR